MSTIFYYTTFLINLIINQYFQNHNCVFIVKELGNFQYSSNQLPVVVINIKNQSDYSLMFINYGCRGIIIDSAKPEISLKEIEMSLLLSPERFNNRRYLIVLNDNKKIDKIFQLKQLNFIADLLVVKIVNKQNFEKLSVNQTGETIFEFFTHKYVGMDDNNAPILINKWFNKNQSFLNENSNLYPDKLKNQQGRKLRISTLTYPPYSIPVVDNNGGFMSFYGSELSAAIYFAKTHNMTPIGIVNDDQLWGDIYENFTGTGLRGKLLDDSADIGFGSVAVWESAFRYLDFAIPLMRTSVTGLVPAPKVASGLLTPVNAFSPQIWIGVGCTFIISIIVLSFEFYFYNHNSVMLEVYNVESHESLFQYVTKSVGIAYRIFLSQSVTDSKMPKEIFTKVIATILMVFGLLITSLYSSSYSSIMTVPHYQKPIDTVKDLADSGLHLSATSTAWIEAILVYEEPEYRKVVQGFIVATEEDLEKYSKTEQFAFALERFPGKSHAIGGFIKKDIIKYYRVMKYDIYWTYCVIMTRKDSILLPIFNDFALNALETGLVLKWHDMAVDSSLDPYVQRVLRNPQKDGIVVKLNWTHVVGAFTILLFGYSISVAVFIVEIFTFRGHVREVRKKFKILN